MNGLRVEGADGVAGLEEGGSEDVREESLVGVVADEEEERASPPWSFADGSLLSGSSNSGWVTFKLEF